MFLVVVLPSWTPELFQTVPDGPWSPGADDRAPPTPEAELGYGWMSGDLPLRFDVTSENLEIRRLGRLEKGSLDHRTLAPGASSKPACESREHEIWFVIEGHGELWRAGNGEKTAALLWPGVGFDIPAAPSSSEPRA